MSSNDAEPFERKMTPEKIEQAKRLFKEHPNLTCKDVADTIKISESTLRNHLRNECIQATGRNLPKGP